MFSITIPLYNKVKTVGRTIESVLNQSFQQFEIVIINDGSTDGSEQVASSYKDERITIFHQPNKGLNAARNECIRRAKYDLITMLDADDRFEPDFLLHMKELIEGFPSCDVFSSNYFIEKRGKVITPKLFLPFKKTGIITDYYEAIMRNSEVLIWTCASVIRKQVLLDVGLYDEHIERGDDFDMWYRLFPERKLAFLNECLVTYGESDDNRITVATIRNIKPETELLFNLDKHLLREKKYPQIKKWFDQYRLKYLRFYHMKGGYDGLVKKVLKDVNPSSYSLSSFLFFNIPRPLLRIPYEVLRAIKRVVIRY